MQSCKINVIADKGELSSAYPFVTAGRPASSVKYQRAIEVDEESWRIVLNAAPDKAIKHSRLGERVIIVDSKFQVPLGATTFYLQPFVKPNGGKGANLKYFVAPREDARMCERPDKPRSAERCYTRVVDQERGVIDLCVPAASEQIIRFSAPKINRVAWKAFAEFVAKRPTSDRGTYIDEIDHGELVVLETLSGDSSTGLCAWCTNCAEIGFTYSVEHEVVMVLSSDRARSLWAIAEITLFLDEWVGKH